MRVGVVLRLGRLLVVRLSGSAAVVADGLHVPGVYQALLENEREEHAEARRVRVNPDDHSQGFYARSTFLLDALESGVAVVVPSWRLGGHSVPCGDAFREYRRRLRPKHWVVSPDDVVRPAPPGVRIEFPGSSVDVATADD